MGKLRGHTVYVSGSIERAIDGGVGWRRQIKPRLQAMGIGVIDPTDKPDGSQVDEAEMRNIANKAKADGDYNKVRDMYKKIVHEDLRYTDLASFLIVNVDMDNHLCGSLDEVFMAANQQKPVIIVCEKGMEHIPNWMYGRLQHELFFTSFDDMFAYLERLDAGLEPDLDRWVFIDYKKVFGEQAHEVHDIDKNNNEHLEKLVRLGVSRNILCFDTEAKEGEPTTRLVRLMLETAKENESSNLNAMIVPKNFVDIEEVQPMYLSFLRFMSSSNYVPTTVHGVKIYYSDFSVKSVIEKLGGILQYQDKYGVVMFNDKKPIEELTEKDVLLGSY